MKKKITVGNEEIELSEFECQANERLEYGLSIYLVTWVPCKVWEYLMPSGTLREQQYRGINNLWVDFIQGGNKLELLNQFVDKLSSHTGINFHVATKDTMPRSIYDRLTELGMSFREDSDSVTLVAYANNKKSKQKQLPAILAHIALMKFFVHLNVILVFLLRPCASIMVNPMIALN